MSEHWRIAHSERTGGPVLQVDTEWLAQKISNSIASVARSIRDAFLPDSEGD